MTKKKFIYMKYFDQYLTYIKPQIIAVVIVTFIGVASLFCNFLPHVGNRAVALKCII